MSPEQRDEVMRLAREWNIAASNANKEMMRGLSPMHLGKIKRARDKLEAAFTAYLDSLVTGAA